MKIRDLPPEELEELLDICAEQGLNCDHVLSFEIEKLPVYSPGAVEDREALIDSRTKWWALKNEFNGLIDPMRAQYPDLGTEKLISFLSKTDQARAYAIDRELLEMTGVSVVKCDRQTWREAVENEILHQLHRASIDVDEIVASVLSRDPAYPAGPVRQYVEFIMEMAILGEYFALRRMRVKAGSEGMR
jgi:hypothetical protein